MSAAPRTIDTSAVKGSEPDGLRRIDRLVEQAALVMVPTGFVLIILGWVGASRTPLLFEQISYLISGGILGLGLAVCGGLLYVGGWIARTAQLVPTQSPLDDLAAQLATLGGTGAGAAATAEYVRTPSGSMFHRRDCSIVAGRDDVVAVAAVDVDEWRPCGMCDPMAG